MSLLASAASTPFRPLVAGFLLLALLSVGGVPLAGETATSLFCLALLLLGLPHGALDIERLKSASRAGWRESLGLFTVYLALAATTYAAWALSPVLALGLFLFRAILHFGEDWAEMDDPLLALGMAAALLALPALLHKDELRSIFAVVTGEEDGALLAEAMRAIAPVALGLAIAGMIGLWRAGRGLQAGCGALLLTTMLLIPPIPAFALFFCLYHSPMHLREAWQSVSGARGVRIRVAAGLTAAAAGIAAVLGGAQWRGSLDNSLVAATFITFSVLTVPHMLAPMLVSLGRRPMRQAATP